MKLVFFGFDVILRRLIWDVEILSWSVEILL